MYSDTCTNRPCSTAEILLRKTYTFDLVCFLYASLSHISNPETVKRTLLQQARNQGFFRAGQFSWNQGTLINNDVQHEKERPRREKSPVFSLGNFLKLRSEREIYHIDDHNQGTFYQFYEKGRGDLPLPHPSPLQLRPCLDRKPFFSPQIKKQPALPRHKEFAETEN